MKIIGQVKDWSRFAAKIAKALQAVDDLKIPFMLIAQDWYKDNMQIKNLKGPGMYPDFKGDRYGEKLGGKGKKVQPGYTRYMQAKENKVGFVYPLLVRTGRMIDSITIPGHSDAVMIVEKKLLVLGTNVDYAIYHQSSDMNRPIMPYRPIIFNKAVRGGFANVFQARMERYSRIINTYIAKVLHAI